MRKGEKVGNRKFNTTKEKINLDKVLDEFIVLCERRGLSQTTITGYRYNWKYFLEFLCDKAITHNTLSDYVGYLQEQGKKPTTINSYVRNISPVLKWGADMGYFPRVKFIQVEEQEQNKDIYTQEELNLLLAKPRTKDFTTLRNWAMVWTFISTGIRRSELINLRINNLDFINRTVLLTKTKNKQLRYIPLSSSLIEVLEFYLKMRKGEGNDYLFPTVYNTRMSNSTLSKAIEGYNTSRGVLKTGIHLFRHTFITNSINKNVNILTLKRITGHKNLTVLNRYYNTKTKDIVDVIDDITPQLKRKKL